MLERRSLEAATALRCESSYHWRIVASIVLSTVVVLGLFAVPFYLEELQLFRQEQEIARKISSLGGDVIWSYYVRREPTSTEKRPFLTGVWVRAGFFQRVISVKVNSKIPPDILSEIGNLSNLVDLDVTGSQLTDDGLRQLSGLTKIEELILENNPITDDGLKYLMAMTSLRRLVLYETNVTLDGLQILDSLKKLKYINTDDCPNALDRCNGCNRRPEPVSGN